MSFSLRTQLLFVAGVSVVCACLAYPDPIVGDLFYTAGMLLFAFGTIWAIYSRGQRRAFLIGFLILFGGYYFFTVMSGEMRLSWLYIQQGGGMRYASPGFITSKLLAYAYEGMHTAGFAVPSRYTGRPSAMSEQTVGGYIAFLIVGHTVVALGLGLLGGRIAQWLALPTPPVARRSIETILEDMDLQ